MIEQKQEQFLVDEEKLKEALLCHAFSIIPGSGFIVVDWERIKRELRFCRVPIQYPARIRHIRDYIKQHKNLENWHTAMDLLSFILEEEQHSFKPDDFGLEGK